MTMVAVVGGKGAPGATTTALALTLQWPLEPGRRVVLVEADPAGGSVLPGALAGRVSADYGLHHLGLADRRGELEEYFFRQLISLSGQDETRLLVPGLAYRRQAPTLAETWAPLAQLLLGLEHMPISHDVIVDLGQNGATTAPSVLAHRADVVLLVVRATLRSVHAARAEAEELRRDLKENGTGADALGLCVIKDGPYSCDEVARQLQVPLLMELPYQRDPARILSDGDGAFNDKLMRSQLLKSAATGADAVVTHARTRRVRLAVPRPAAPEATRA